MPIIGQWKPGERRRCKGKQAIPSSKAEQIAKQMSKRDGEWLVAYECCDCGWHHVGHADSTDRAILAQLNRAANKRKQRRKSGKP